MPSSGCTSLSDSGGDPPDEFVANPRLELAAFNLADLLSEQRPDGEAHQATPQVALRPGFGPSRHLASLVAIAVDRTHGDPVSLSQGGPLSPRSRAATISARWSGVRRGPPRRRSPLPLKVSAAVSSDGSVFVAFTLGLRAIARFLST